MGNVDKLEDAFCGKFMQPEIHHGTWHVIDGTAGTWCWPAEHVTCDQAVANYSGEVGEIETIEGYGARLSASGYLDSTDWSVFDTAENAAEHLLSMYADG